MNQLRALAKRSGGSVLVITVMMMPVLMAALALVVEGGRLIHLRHQLSVAADMGALAGVQRIDLDRLAAGERYIPPAAAAADAREWAERNLDALLPENLARRSHVDVYVMNASEEQPMTHPRTGRTITMPTVSTVITIEDVPLYLMPQLAPVTVSAHADASVDTR